jgi:type IV secretion system protein VirD4
MSRFEQLPRGLPHSPEASGASARRLWMNHDELAAGTVWRFGAGKLFLGALPNGQLVGYNDDRHMLTVAGSRAGKGVSVIVPNLLTYDGSMLVLDPKGENASLTAERRGQGRGVPKGGLGQSVFVLDPFRCADVAEDYRAGFNPLGGLDPRDLAFVDDCASIADALVVAEAGKESDHWNSSARLVLRGFVAWVGSGDGKRDLVEVRRLLHLPPDDFDNLLEEMIDNPERAYRVPAEMAAALQGMGGDEMGSVLSTVRQNITFLSSPQMAAMLEGSGRAVDLKTWKMGGQTVYLCLPAGYLHQHARFFRLFLNRLLAAVEQVKTVPERRAVMMLDEMHVLGHMAQLETAAGLFAGYGVKIWSIWQDFSQLQALYRERWETFIGNTSVLQSFGLNDLRTLKYVSELLGVSSILSISEGELAQSAAAGGFTGQSKTIQQSPLLTPDEVAFHFARQRDALLVQYTGASPIYLERVKYYDHPHFAGMWKD